MPKTYVEGWSGWQRVIGATKVFIDIKATITTYCIFDSDFHIEEEKKERIEEAKNHKLLLHIWNKKEIENYLISASVVYRIIKKAKPKNNITIQEIECIIDQFCEELKEYVIDSYATEFFIRDRIGGIAKANKNARSYVANIWKYNKKDVVPGKKIISLICNWVNENFNININRFKIARAFEKEEICLEMKTLITNIENCSPI